MKISQTGSGSPTGRSRKAGKLAQSDDANAFRQHIGDDGAPATSGPAASGTLASLGSLLSIQEVPDSTAERKRAVQHGDRLLDELRELQIGLAQGWLPEDMLRNLSQMLNRPRPAIDDPDLNMVLDEIEVRAAVELAKLEQQAP